MNQSNLKLIGLLLGPAVASAIILTAHLNNSSNPLWILTGIIALMLIWWISEAVPLPVTALIPIVLLPALGIQPAKDVTPNYTHPMIFLMFAGFTLALAIQKVNLHERIVLATLRAMGNHINAIIFGFMLSACLLSMWLSNTATTAAMLPIALSFISIFQQQQQNTNTTNNNRHLALVILLGIAFAANVGGTATLIGTAPNALFAGYIKTHFNIDMGFLTWMLITLPFTFIMLGLIWIVLTKIVFRQITPITQPSNKNPPNKNPFSDILKQSKQSLGKFSYEEKAVSILFAITVLAWISKPAIPIPYLSNTVIGITATIAAFAIPIKINPLQFILTWKDMHNLPWGVLLLLGGGLALSDAMTTTGFSQNLGEIVTTHIHLGDHIWIVFAALGLTLTEFASNTAMLATLLPVVSDIAVREGSNPLLYGIPLTLATSCAFMMPMATPPNALVFASGYIRVSDMIKAGFLLNILALLTLTLVVTITIPLFGL